jgi:hypothetical protein
MVLENLRNWTGQIEALATDAVAKVAPWAAPIPTAYLVGRATVEHLHWPMWVGFITAVIVESLGLATTATALELREYNQSKRKSDPVAPFPLAAVLVGVYLLIATGLTVALDIAPTLAVYSPAIFPLLSLCGVTVLGLRGDHRRRVGAIEAVKAERKAKRYAKRQSTHQATAVELSENVSNNEKSNTNLDDLQTARMSKREARMDNLLTFYASNPDAGATEAGRAIGVSRQTIYTYNTELEQTGRLRHNGQGWEVLA